MCIGCLYLFIFIRIYEYTTYVHYSAFIDFISCSIARFNVQCIRIDSICLYTLYCSDVRVYVHVRFSLAGESVLFFLEKRVRFFYRYYYYHFFPS